MLNYIFLGIGSTVNSILLNSQKRTDIQFRTTIIYLIVGIPMGVFFIPRYGVLGFQATTMLAPKLGLLYSILWIRKNLGISLELVSTVKIASSAILGYMACRTVLIILSFNVWIELFLGGIAISVTYMVSIMLTGALIAKNFNDIKHITDKNRLGKTLVGPILEYLIKHAKK